MQEAAILMKHVDIHARAGSFAENKDVARDIRLGEIVPALERQEDVLLDFSGVKATTQSFIHALISDLMRKYGSDVLEHVEFKSCNDTVRKIITIVVEYMQEA